MCQRPGTPIIPLCTTIMSSEPLLSMPPHTLSNGTQYTGSSLGELAGWLKFLIKWTIFTQPISLGNISQRRSKKTNKNQYENQCCHYFPAGPVALSVEMIKLCVKVTIFFLHW